MKVKLKEELKHVHTHGLIERMKQRLAHKVNSVNCGQLILELQLKLCVLFGLSQVANENTVQENK